METISPLLVRADCSESIGLGHVMRTLALAQAWQDAGGNAAYAVASCQPVIEERLRKEDIEVVRLSPQVGSAGDAWATVDAARVRGAVLDRAGRLSFSW